MALDEVACEAVGFAGGGAVADGDERDPVFRGEPAERVQRAVPVVFRGMRIDGRGVDDLAGGVDDGDLHASAQAGVEPQGRARPCGCGKQQVAQVAREDLDGLGFGADAQRAHELGFQMHAHLHAPGEAHGVHQPAVGGAAAVGDAEAGGDARLAGVVRIVPRRLCGFAVEAQAYVEQVFAPAAEDGERAVRGHGGQRLGVVEIVGVFFRRTFLACDHAGLHHAVILQVFAQALQEGGILGEALHQDLARAVKRGLGIGHAGVVAVGGAEGIAQVAHGFGFGRQHRVGEQGFCQRLQSGFARNLRAGAAFGLVRQVEIFELRLVGRQQDRFAQFGRELVLFVNGLEDRGAAGFEFAQVTQPFFQQAQLRVVQAVGGLLAVARNERHGRAFVEQCDGSGDLDGFGRDFGGETMFDGGQHEAMRWLTRPAGHGLNRGP